MYVYIETSSPRQPGDTARLESPWMRGPQCMTFFYHMYGATMGCLVIYIKSQATNKFKPVWFRSQDQGDHWVQGKISINETSSYQVRFEMWLLTAHSLLSEGRASLARSVRICLVNEATLNFFVVPCLDNCRRN